MRKNLVIIAECIEALINYKENKQNYIADHGADEVKKACNQAIYRISLYFPAIVMYNKLIGYKVPSLLDVATYTMGKKELDFERIDKLVDDLEKDLPKIKNFIEILPENYKTRQERKKDE